MLEQWIWFATRRGFGPVRQREMLERFGSAEALWEATESAMKREGIAPAARELLLDKDLTEAKRILAACGRAGISVLTLNDPAYPTFLRAIADAPSVLYYRGTLLPVDRLPCVAVVGARGADRRGLEMARRLGWQIAGCGGTVVTGMAKGIDAEAAWGALDRGGAVIGVLGCGADVVYPRENAALYAAVAERGCLLTEYPPGTAPTGNHFPARNRIISALSDGVAVVQASERSGALITARWAGEQGRDVFAVPGPAGDDLSRGTNRLLREGAILIESGWDVMCEYEYRYPGLVREYHGRPEPAAPRPAPAKAPAPPPAPAKAPRSAPEKAPAPGARSSPKKAGAGLTGPQKAVVDALKKGPLQLDALLEAVDLPASVVLPQLTMLQIKGIIVQRPGKIYESTINY